MQKNVISFKADMGSSVHNDNKSKDILILGVGPTQRLDNTILTEEVNYPINFTQLGKKFVVSLHYNGSNSSWFVNATKIYQFKAKEYYALYLGNISKGFIIINTGLKRSMNFVVVDITPIDASNISNIHKYLRKIK